MSNLPATTSYGEWWQRWSRQSYGETQDANIKRAILLQAVNTTVRIVDDSIPPFAVRFADTDISATDLENRLIIISPKPTDPKLKLTDDQRLDLLTFEGLHEASHCQYTADPYKLLKTPTELEPYSVAGTLANIIEDGRIEHLTSLEYPGFAGYFPNGWGWLWTQRPKEANPMRWDTLPNKINAIIVMLRHAEHVRNAETWQTNGSKNIVLRTQHVLEDKSFDAEIPWWQAWSADYLDGRTNLRQAVEAGLERLRQQNPKEMAERQAQDRKAKEDNKKMRQIIEDWINSVGIEGACASDLDFGDLLSEEDAEQVRRLVESQLHGSVVPIQDGYANPAIYVLHPPETPESRRAYIGSPSNMVAKMRAVLRFRPELPRYTEKLLKDGTFDEEEIWRAGMGDYRVFERPVIEMYPNAQVSLLCDMSGSMSGRAGHESKVQVAQRFAQLFILAMLDMNGITPKVFGHASERINSRVAEVLRIWEPGEPLSRLGLISSERQGSTYDGHAISWCVKELQDRGGPADQRLLIVLSDGESAGTEYGGTPAANHVRTVVQNAAKRSVTVLQVAIDSSVNPQFQASMFGRQYVPYTTTDATITAFARMLGRTLNA